MLHKIPMITGQHFEMCILKKPGEPRRNEKVCKHILCTKTNSNDVNNLNIPVIRNKIETDNMTP